MRRVIVDDATGLVLMDWLGGEGQALVLAEGQTLIAVSDDAPRLAGSTWLGGTSFSPAPPPTPAQAALIDSRRKDIATTCALLVQRRDPAAWQAMTEPERLQAVANEVARWRQLREFLDDKVV